MSEHITRLHDVDSLQADVLNALAKSIDKCRTELSQLNVQEERTYRYAIIRSYSKVLLTSCEVYTLLKEGYPEGALSLSRSLYEAMVIINKLLKGASSNDDQIIECFFDAAIISQLQIDIESAKWVLNKDTHHRSTQMYLENRNKELEIYQAKYPGNKFKDYWWAGVDSFRALADKTDFPKDYMYKRACGNVHFNAYNAMHYIDMSEDSIVIGNTNSGIELPLWYASLTLYIIVGIIHAEMPDLISDDILLSLEATTKSASTLLQKAIKVHGIK